MTTHMEKVYIGVDVAARKLDLTDLPKQVDNQPAAIKRWLRTLPAGAHLVCESTGAYHKLLLRLCWQLGIAVSRVNPEQVRAFAKGQGLRAKTDRLDARVLAEFGRRQQPAPTLAPDPVRARLQEFNTRRLQLVAMRTQELNRQQQPELDKSSAASVRRMLTVLAREIAKLEKAADQLLGKSEELTAQVALLTQVEGVGQRTAKALLATIPELGTVSRQRIAGLAGLAPLPRESGQWKGQRHICGGRTAVRQALYMAALSAMRCNPQLKPFAAQLTARGKPFRLVITAVMRKLLLCLNARLRQHLIACNPQPNLT